MCDNFVIVLIIHEISLVYITPVDRGLHSSPSEEFEDPALSNDKLELSDVYKTKTTKIKLISVKSPQ